MTFIALDVGNTRLKWALYDSHHPDAKLLTQGAVFLGEDEVRAGQATVKWLREAADDPDATEETSILKAPTMLKVASIIGNMLCKVRQEIDEKLSTMKQGASASMIVAGQRKGGAMRLFLIYPEGNFIEASFDTPFFQIGETKYGRPIILRGYDPDMSFEDAVKLLMVSFDSTLKANLSVGLPIDMMVIARDTFAPLHERRIDSRDSYFRTISSGWGEALKKVFDSLPGFSF